MRLKEVRGDRLAKEVAAAINRAGLDVSMLSRFENGRCLPTVTDMEHIERGYGATRHELYEPHELDFRPAMPRKRDTHKLTRKLTVRLTDELASVLTVKNLRICGYPTKQAWIWACAKVLRRQLNRKLATQRETGPDVVTIETGETSRVG